MVHSMGWLNGNVDRKMILLKLCIKLLAERLNDG